MTFLFCFVSEVFSLLSSCLFVFACRSFLTRGGGGLGTKKSRGEEQEEEATSSSSSSASSSLSSRATASTSSPVIPQKKSKKNENDGESFCLVNTEKKEEGKRESMATPGKREGEDNSHALDSELQSPDKKRMKKSIESTKNEASLSLPTARSERERRQAWRDEDHQDERRTEKNGKISSPASDAKSEEKKKKEEDLFNHRDDAVDKKEEKESQTKDTDMLVEVEGNILRNKKKVQLKKEGSSEADSSMKEEDQDKEMEKSQAERDDRKPENKNRMTGVDGDKGFRQGGIREHQETKKDDAKTSSSSRGEGIEGEEDAGKDYGEAA